MCRLKVRFSQSSERRGVFNYALKVEVTDATGIPSKIFVYHQSPAGMDGNTFAEFDHVATPVDFQEIPEDAASEIVPWFRTDKCVVWFRNVSDLELAKQLFVDDINALQRTFGVLTTENGFRRQTSVEFSGNVVQEADMDDDGTISQEIKAMKKDISGKVSKDAMSGVNVETNTPEGLRAAVQGIGSLLGANVVKSIAVALSALSMSFGAYGAGFSGEHFDQIDLDENPLMVTNVTFDGLATLVDITNLIDSISTNFVPALQKEIADASVAGTNYVDSATNDVLSAAGDYTDSRVNNVSNELATTIQPLLDIPELIPVEAAPTNQLADKNYVNSALAGKADKVVDAKAGDIAALDANGNLKLSGMNRDANGNLNATEFTYTQSQVADYDSAAVGTTINKANTPVVLHSGEYWLVRKSFVKTSSGWSVDSVTGRIIKPGAIGIGSMAWGDATSANGNGADSEGKNTRASGAGAHAEGQDTDAIATAAHAEGLATTASGSCSHSEGANTFAGGTYSHAEGSGTKTQNIAEHAQGQYNWSNHADNTFGSPGNTLMSVGIGTSDSFRTNAMEVMQDGKVYVKGIGGYVGRFPLNATDLATVMSGKADDDAVVKLAGDQTIAGNKTFYDDVAIAERKDLDVQGGRVSVRSLDSSDIALFEYDRLEYSTDDGWTWTSIMFDNIATADIIAPKWAFNSTYEVGDLCTSFDNDSSHSGTWLYKCILAPDPQQMMPPESDATHWTLATVEDVLAALRTALAGKEDSSNKVTSLTAQSTDAQYPSAKCVYDAIQGVDVKPTRIYNEAETDALDDKGRLFKASIPGASKFLVTKNSTTTELPFYRYQSEGNAFNGHSVYSYGTWYTDLVCYDPTDGVVGFTHYDSGYYTRNTYVWDVQVPKGLDPRAIGSVLFSGTLSGVQFGANDFRDVAWAGRVPTVEPDPYARFAIEAMPTAWAASTTYMVGVCASYDGKAYRCKTEHTSGSTFDASKWDEIPVLSQKADRAANPTAGNLAALDSNGNPTDSTIPATNVVTKAMIDANNATFSNAVLSVGLGIDTNTVAAINELVDSSHGLPVSGATSVGALLLALAAAIAALKRGKANGSSIAAEFSTSETYAVDKAVMYQGVRYRCTTAVTTAGAWTGSANWTAETVQTAIENAGGGGDDPTRIYNATGTDALDDKGQLFDSSIVQSSYTLNVGGVGGTDYTFKYNGFSNCGGIMGRSTYNYQYSTNYTFICYDPVLGKMFNVGYWSNNWNKVELDVVVDAGLNPTAGDVLPGMESVQILGQGGFNNTGTLTFTKTQAQMNSTSYAHFALESLPDRTWAAGTWAVGDLVKYSDKAYRCKAATTASDTTAPSSDTTHWEEIPTLNGISATLGDIETALHAINNGSST